MKKIILVFMAGAAIGLSGCSSKHNAKGNQKFVPLEVMQEMQSLQKKADALNKESAKLNKEIARKEQTVIQQQKQIGEMNAIIQQAK